MSSVPTIGVAIPTIPPRRTLLLRAMESVTLQTTPVSQISVSVDVDRRGAAVNRTRALNAIETDWVAFLDDDDAFDVHHIEKLLKLATETNADFVFSYFTVVNGVDPFPQHFGRDFDPTDPHHPTVVTMVRTELAKKVGFVSPDDGDGCGGGGEDWDFLLRCMAEGAVVKNLHERTWFWFHGTGNTSGRPDRW